jgi:hypothetical protein
MGGRGCRLTWPAVGRAIPSVEAGVEMDTESATDVLARQEDAVGWVYIPHGGGLVVAFGFEALVGMSPGENLVLRLIDPKQRRSGWV